MSQVDEFNEGASEWPPYLPRREFLKLASATLALAGVTACVRAPREMIFPYVRQPEDMIPGHPLHFATAQVIDGLAHGLIVENHMGRPTRADGNPLHPAMGGGAASAIHQAYVYSLYNPSRARQVTLRGEASNWDQAFQALHDLRAGSGRGIWILTEASTSPTLKAQMHDLQRKLPALRWVQYSPMVVPREWMSIYDFERAAVIVALDADIFSSPEFPLTYVRDFTKARRQGETSGKLNQLFVAECSASLTGFSATVRKAMTPGELARFAENLDLALSNQISVSSDFLQQLEAAVRAAPGRCAFVAGDHQPQALHELARRLNRQWGRECVREMRDPRWSANLGPKALGELTAALGKGEVEHLLICGGNPAARAPRALGLASLIKRAKHSYRLSLFADETARLCEWHLPMSHGLETWTDALAFDGTPSIAQPLITPLYDTRSLHEIAEYLTTGKQTAAHDLVARYWQTRFGKSFAQDWRKSLQRGIVSEPHRVESAPAPQRLTVPPPAPMPALDEVIVCFRPDIKVHDGAFTQNAWLREWPDPLTRVSWQNVIWVSPRFASDHKLRNGQWLHLEVENAQLEGPIWIQPGQPKKVVTLFFGYGEDFLTDTSQPKGYSAAELWSAEQPRYLTAKFKTLTKSSQVACTQEHQEITSENIIQTVSLKNPRARTKSPGTGLYSPLPDDFNNAWGMVIDLDSCIGCGACVIACQAENNIPVVGHEQVLLGREMHWIRVDRYYSGASGDPQAHFQPVPCMHCEQAPCEAVCPVGATVHGNGGLNQMIYNRCVGTRYCSNNCPYKVRRFNFLQYAKNDPISNLLNNPDVSVRPRGVMEKCTYCVQRINATRKLALNEKREIAANEVQTACQRTCPANAIVFGDLRKEGSEVRRQRESPRHYTLLEELGTHPRTTYLAEIEGDGT